MTCLAPQGVRTMQTVEVLNLSNRDHAGFMYDLATVCQKDFLNDYDNDVILLMNEYERAIDDGSCKAFLAKVEDQPAGIIWTEIDRYGVGRVRAGLMPEFRRGHIAYSFMRQFIDYCFNVLSLRKLDAELTLWRDRNRSSMAAEKILRRIGFRKQGLIEDALLIGGKPYDTLLFGLTKKRYEKTCPKNRAVVKLRHRQPHQIQPANTIAKTAF